MKRIITRIFFFLMSLSLLYIPVSCGIDELPVLSQPVKGTTSDVDNFFQFRATDKNGSAEEPAFRGFEIYFKFYSTDSNGLNLLSSEKDFITVSELESKNYRRITYYIDDDECDKPTQIIKPLIKVPGDSPMRGTEALITIDFSDWQDVHIRSEPDDYFEIPGSPDPAKLPIRRSIEDDENPGFFKSFEKYKITDNDVAGLSSLSDYQEVYIQVYVLSFGRYDLSETVYSDALYLSYIKLTNMTIE